MSTELHEVDTTSVKQKHLLIIEKTLSVRIETLLLPVHILGSRFKFQMFAIFCTLLEIDLTLDMCQDQSKVLFQIAFTASIREFTG